MDSESTCCSEKTCCSTTLRAHVSNLFDSPPTFYLCASVPIQALVPPSRRVLKRVRRIYRPDRVSRTFTSHRRRLSWYLKWERKNWLGESNSSSDSSRRQKHSSTGSYVKI
eukprot:3203458-Amphidinium_carterae.1